MKKAFTLLELMIVVIIIGILASLAIPMFQGARYKAIMTEIFPNVNCVEQSIELYIAEHDWPPSQMGFLDEDPGFLAGYDLPGESKYFRYAVLSGANFYTIQVRVKPPFPDGWLCRRLIMKDGPRLWQTNMPPSPIHPWAKYLNLP